MNRYIPGVLSMVLIVGIMNAQPTKTEIANPASRFDTMLNSSSVPDVYAINGRFERIVVLRIKYQTDLLSGMEEMVKEEKIRNASSWQEQDQR